MFFWFICILPLETSGTASCGSMLYIYNIHFGGFPPIFGLTPKFFCTKSGLEKLDLGLRSWIFYRLGVPRFQQKRDDASWRKCCDYYLSFGEEDNLGLWILGLAWSILEWLGCEFIAAHSSFCKIEWPWPTTWPRRLSLILLIWKAGNAPWPMRPKNSGLNVVSLPATGDLCLATCWFFLFLRGFLGNPKENVLKRVVKYLICFFFI